MRNIIYALTLIMLIGCGGGVNEIPVNRCGTVIDISENAFINERLEVGHCQLNQLFPGVDFNIFFQGNSNVDEFRVTIPTGGTLQINMRSTEFDTFLLVVNTTGSCSGGCSSDIILARHDDISPEGINTDSFISIVLTAGTYMIHASSFRRVNGNYNLETFFF